MGSPFTYEEMKANQARAGATGPDGPVVDEPVTMDTPDVSGAEDAPGDTALFNQPAQGADEPTIPLNMGAPAESTNVVKPAMPTKGEVGQKQAKRAVVFNALRNSEAGMKEFARHLQRAYGSKMVAPPEKIIRAAYNISARRIEGLTPEKYIKAMHNLYGKKVDEAMLAQGRIDYPGLKDEDSLIDTMYQKKIAREEFGHLSWADKADIIARRYPELAKSDKEPEKALRLVYDTQKKKGKDVGTFDDWMHTQMGWTVGEWFLKGGPAIGKGFLEQAKNMGKFGMALATPQKVQALIESAQAGDEKAKEKLIELGKGGVDVAAFALAPAEKMGIAGLEAALAAKKGVDVARSARGLVGVLEGASSGYGMGAGEAAVEGKRGADIGVAATLPTLLGGALGGVGEHVVGVRAANTEAKVAAQAAAADEAAKAAGAGAVGRAAIEAPPVAPVAPKTTLDAAAMHKAETGWGAVVTNFAKEHGIEPDLAGRLAVEKPELGDLARANDAGIKPADIAELRQAMPEHLGGPGEPVPAPRMRYEMTPEELAASDAKKAEYLKNGPSPESPQYAALKQQAAIDASNPVVPPEASDALARLKQISDIIMTPEERLKMRAASAPTAEIPAEGLVKPEVPAAGPAPSVTEAPPAVPPVSAEAAPAAPPEPGLLTPPELEAVTKGLNRAQGQLAKRRAMIRGQLSQRFARAQKAFGEAGGGLAGWKAKLSVMAGEMQKPDWAGIADEFKDVNLNSLHNAIVNSTLSEGDKLTAAAGLMRLWNGTRMGAPTLSQIRALRTAFGSEFAEAVAKNPTTFQKVLRGLQKTINTPRVAMTTGDLSLGGRQGYLMAAQPEYRQAWVTMVKAFGVDKVAQDVVETIKTDPLYKIFKDSGLFLQGEGFGTKAEYAGGDVGSWVDNWIGVKNSQRAADAFINKTRTDMFRRVYNDMEAAGVDVTDPQFRESLAHWLNTGTGRGNLGGLNRAASVLNQVAFSPRLAWSRIETFNPMYYVGMHPEITKLAWQSNLKVIGGTAALLSALGMSGVATVGTDPRSSDFAKARFGNTRIDLLAGHQQMARVFAQLVTGKVVNSVTGQLVDLNGSDSKNGFTKFGKTRLDVLSRFAESKSSPIASIIMNTLRGSDFLGRPISIPNEVLTRVTPMVAQDIRDAIVANSDLRGSAVAPVALAGLGVQSYAPSLPASAGGERKPDIGVAMEGINIGKELWDHLNGNAPSRDMKFVTPKLADQWVLDNAMGQVMGQQEATRVKGFFDPGFDQKAAIKKAQASRSRKINKLYKDLAGGNGEAARHAAEANMLQRRAEVTGMDIEALKNPNIYREVSK